MGWDGGQKVWRSPRDFRSNPGVPPPAGKEAEEKRAALLCCTQCLTVSGDDYSGLLVFMNSSSAGLLFAQA